MSARPTIDETVKLAAARQLVAVGKSLRAFDFKGEQYLSKAVS
jgi:hypothetical protein